MIGWNTREETDMAETVTTFEAATITEEVQKPEPASEPQSVDEPAASQETPNAAQPQSQVQPAPAPQPVQRIPAPPPVVLNSIPLTPIPTPAPTQAPAPVAPARTYGPPDTGGSGYGSDSQRVGTAPNGAPLYAARWYREPTRQEMSGYLSTANGPGTALIACRTVPNFRVEDCELLGESPQGSQIGRAVLAATWQFRVRPARIGGQSQVGSWVRIRIDYTERRER